MSPTFANFPELHQKFILENMLGLSPIETMSSGGDLSSKGATPEVVSMEALVSLPTTPRLPKPKPTSVRETKKPNKEK